MSDVKEVVTDGNLEKVEVRPDEEIKDLPDTELSDAEVDRKFALEELGKTKSAPEPEEEVVTEDTKTDEEKADEIKEDAKPKIVIVKKDEVKEEDFKVVSKEELMKKKGWKDEEEVIKSYQHLEKKMSELSKSASLTTKEKQDLEIRMAKLEGMQEAMTKAKDPNLSTEDRKQAQEDLDEKLRTLMTESPSQYNANLLAKIGQIVEKTVGDTLKKNEASQVKVTKADEQLMDILPGETVSDKRAAFDQIKPELEKLLEKKPYLNTEDGGGLVDAYKILLSEGTIKIEQGAQPDATTEINRQKKGVSQNGKGQGAPKATKTSKDLDKMSAEEKALLSDAEIDAIVLAEEKAKRNR